MKKFVFWICMLALVPGSIWGYGVIRAGLDARDGGPRPSAEPSDKVQRVVHQIVRSGYDWYYRNFSKVGKHERETSAELGL